MRAHNVLDVRQWLERDAQHAGQTTRVVKPRQLGCWTKTSVTENGAYVYGSTAGKDLVPKWSWQSSVLETHGCMHGAMAKQQELASLRSQLCTEGLKPNLTLTTGPHL